MGPGSRPAAATRDPQRDLTRELACFFLDGFTLDQEHRANVREVDVRIERRTAPNVASIQRLLLAARLDATMVARRDLDKIRGIALVEQQSDIAFQRGLITLLASRQRLLLDREMIVRLLLD